MAFQRRRHHERVVMVAGISGLTAISAAALLIFVLLAFLTVLSPPAVDHPGLPNPSNARRRARRSSMLLESPVELRTVLASEMFRVPSGGGVAGSDLWESKQSKSLYGCSNASEEFKKANEGITYPNRYLMIATSGGLNQQRTGITDAVVAARILNATLVVPVLDQKSYWKDDSKFPEIFDVEWFISYLSKDIKVVNELPQMGGKAIATPYRMRVPRKCTPRCYQSRVLPVLLKKQGCLWSRPLNDGEKYLFVGDSNRAAVETVGIFRLLFRTGACMDLFETFIVPSFRQNLVSISVLDKFCYSCSFRNDMISL